MGKAVVKGRGFLISGTCPKCEERVCVLLKEDERRKNSQCNYCGADIYGDWIYETVKEGHFHPETEKIAPPAPEKKADDAPMPAKPEAPPAPRMPADLLAYDRGVIPGNACAEKQSFTTLVLRAKTLFR